MSLKPQLNRHLILTVLITLVVTTNECMADRVVKHKTTAFGRIKHFDTSKVVIAPGCAGEQTQSINWNDIDPFGGIQFDGTCNADWHASTSGATAEGTGPTATWFAVIFKDDSFLWAEQVELTTDATLKVKVAKGKRNLRGPISKVKAISRNVVYVNDIDAQQFKWPTEFSGK